MLDKITKADEVRFNQLHNGTDIDGLAGEVTVPACDVLGFGEVAAADIAGEDKAEGAKIRDRIAGLIFRYGLWGGAVADQRGRVLSGDQYALTCRLLGYPCRVFRVPAESAEAARAAFADRYGVFSYDHLTRNSYVQTMAQPYRLREPENAGSIQGPNQSALYNWALPEIHRGERILDFGAGQCDYAEHARALGHDVHTIEFFFRKGTGASINTRAAHAMIDAALASYRDRGPFDVVLCDSVVNSVDTVTAEEDVLTCLHGFVRPGGRIYVSGRAREGTEAQARARTAAGVSPRGGGVQFIDGSGLAALFRRGGWFYQKFHTAPEVEAILARYGGEGEIKRLASVSWQVRATVTTPVDRDRLRGALEREFDLPWPGGRTVGRSAAALAAFRYDPA